MLWREATEPTRVGFAVSRQLRHAVERALLMARGRRIEVADLGRHVPPGEQDGLARGRLREAVHAEGCIQGQQRGAGPDVRRCVADQPSSVQQGAQGGHVCGCERVGVRVVRAEAEVARNQQDLTVSETRVLQQETVLKNALSRTGVANPLISDVHVVTTDVIRIPDSERLGDAGQSVADAVDLMLIADIRALRPVIETQWAEAKQTLDMMAMMMAPDPEQIQQVARPGGRRPGARAHGAVAQR